MLQRFSDIAARAWDCARAADREAAAATTASLRTQYARMARSWRILARSFEFSDKMRRFLDERREIRAADLERTDAQEGGDHAGDRFESGDAAAAETGDLRCVGAEIPAELRNISKEAAYCRERAEQCKALAAGAASRLARQEYLDMELRWTVLAENYESSRWLAESGDSLPILAPAPRRKPRYVRCPRNGNRRSPD